MIYYILLLSKSISNAAFLITLHSYEQKTLESTYNKKLIVASIHFLILFGILDENRKIREFFYKI